MISGTRVVEDKLVYKPEPIWPGETVVVIGGGTSLRGFDWSSISNQRVIGVNDAFMLGGWVDWTIFGDDGWYRKYRSDIMYHPGDFLALTNAPMEDFPGNVKWMGREFGKVSDGSNGKLVWFNNTGMSGINLAACFGAARILLLGYDMKLGVNPSTGEPEANWHVNHMDMPRAESYTGWLKQAPMLLKGMNETFPDTVVLNCNPDSELDIWPRVRLEDVL